MKGTSPFVAGLLLLVGTAGLLGLSGQAPEERAGAVSGWALRQELGRGAVAETETLETAPPEERSPPASALESPSPAPVPVETVAEAWDERRQREEAPAEPMEPLEAESDVSLELRNGTDYDVDFTELPALPAGLDFAGEPAVLIVHTHTTESYLKEGENPAEAVYRSRDEDDGVMAVGDAVAEALEARGYRVLHDKTFCDYPEYNGAYDRSRRVIQADLQEHPSVCLVLDIHRDAVTGSDGTQLRMAAEADGADAAQVMLVVGTDDGGLEHPDWRQNLSLAAALQAAVLRRAPGIMRPINLRSERFNQDLGPLALLVEVGASGNSLEEALRGAAVFSEGLADVLDRYSGKNP